MSDPILDVDLLAFEQGDASARRAVVDGVRQSLATGFVYTRHDLSEALIDDAYGMLARFFHLERDVKERYRRPESNGQSGYTGTLVETAAGFDEPDWKEMLNWGPELPAGHPLRRKYPHRYMDRAFPEDECPGITRVLAEFHDRLAELQRRFLRIIAAGLGCHDGYFDTMLKNGPTLTRAIRYPPMQGVSGGNVWAAEHGDINLITALPRATARGLQVKLGSKTGGKAGIKAGLEEAGEWIDAVAPEGHAIINTGLMLEHVTNHVIPAGIHRVVAAEGQTDERYSVVQFCHPAPWTVLSPIPTCVNKEHPPRHGAITAGAWLDEVLYDINLTAT